ncbi:c-type cytochrome [Mucilaginibacter sp. 21P]|nr:c-type cytochrome [Mucilaginibacter sp. 21P]
MFCAACVTIATVALMRKQPELLKLGNSKVMANGGSGVGTSTLHQITSNTWRAPKDETTPTGKEGEMIRYGRDLITHTSKYLGPKGTIAKITNGMNCQNCHLDAGTRLYGNNFSGFINAYPKMSRRAGKIESPAERLVECFERSLNGKAPDTSGREIQSILAYMRWVGKDGKHGVNLIGASTEKMPYLKFAADTAKGNAVYSLKCQNCHGQNGEGVLSHDGTDYTYPPLWGNHSYNDGAGMYRLGSLAGFVKNNMPLGATYQNPQLTNEEAWDVAAFIESKPRAHQNQHSDWKDLNKKPIDFPFGPYPDSFSEKQHKYGPFAPIKAAHNGRSKSSVTNPQK